MALESGKDVVFTFDGVEIGGVQTFEIADGQVRAATLRPLNGPPVARPTMPDYGQVVLNLYRDADDDGQYKLIESLRNRSIFTMRVDYPSGEADTFRCFTLLFPTRGSKNQASPVNMVRCLMRIDGWIE